MKDVIYEKTELGWAEINSRTRKLSGQLRTLLVVIDGQRSVAELLTTLRPLGISDDSFRQLKEAGLIEPVAHVTARGRHQSRAQGLLSGRTDRTDRRCY